MTCRSRVHVVLLIRVLCQERFGSIRRVVRSGWISFRPRPPDTAKATSTTNGAAEQGADGGAKCPTTAEANVSEARERVCAVNSDMTPAAGDS